MIVSCLLQKNTGSMLSVRYTELFAALANACIIICYGAMIVSCLLQKNAGSVLSVRRAARQLRRARRRQGQGCQAQGRRQA